MAETILGIDLGTSNSVAAVATENAPVVILSREGEDYFPSVVCFIEGQPVDAYTQIHDPDTGETIRALVGSSAKEAAKNHPELTIRHAKRQIGKGHVYTVGNRRYSAETISAFVLKKIQDDAEIYLQGIVDEPRIRKARITVPAYFDTNQRAATRDAGQIAGMEVVGLVSEPSAALLAYRHEVGLEAVPVGDLIMVADLGAGTLDIVIGAHNEILSAFGDEMDLINILSITGDTELGGTDMDKAIVAHVLSEMPAEKRQAVTAEVRALIEEAAEGAKIRLSDQSITHLSVPRAGLSGRLSREQLDSLVEPLLQRCRQPIVNGLTDAAEKMVGERNPASINIAKVLLVGGPTKMPIVRERIQQFTGVVPSANIDPMKCVAIGAALWGMDERPLAEPLPFSYGYVEDDLFYEVVPKGSNTPILLEREIAVPPFTSRHVVVAASAQERHASTGVGLGEYPFAVPEMPKWQTVRVTFQANEQQEIQIILSDASGRANFPGVSRRRREAMRFKDFVEFGQEGQERDTLPPAEKLRALAGYATAVAVQVMRYPIPERDQYEIKKGLTLLAEAINSIGNVESVPTSLEVTIERLAGQIINIVQGIELPPDPERLASLNKQGHSMLDRAGRIGVPRDMLSTLEKALDMPEWSKSDTRNKIVAIERALAPIEIDMSDREGPGRLVGR